MKKQQRNVKQPRRPRFSVTEQQLALVRGGANGDCDDGDLGDPVTAIEYRA